MSLLSFASTFIEPVKAAGNLILTCLGQCCIKSRRANEVYIKPAEYVSIKVVNKINKFIEKMGLNPKDILIVAKSYEEGQSPMSASHSIRHFGYAKLLLSAKMVKEIKSQFTDVHKFLIAHELGHIKIDDYFISLRTRLIANASSLCIYGISIAYDRALGNYSYLSHMTACTIATVARLIFESYETRKLETNADNFALTKSIEIAEGGKKYFAIALAENLQVKAQIIASMPPMKEGPINLLKCFDFIISPQGDNVLDFAHPPLTSRLIEAEKIAAHHLAKPT